MLYFPCFGATDMTLEQLASKKTLSALMLCIGLIQIAGYYLAGMLASTDGSMAVPQPDTLLYCQAARRIVEGCPFSFSAGTAVSTGTTSVLYPFILAIPYWLGATGEALFMAGFWLNALFYLVFLFGWGQVLWNCLENPLARLTGAVLLALSAQPAFCAMAQSDIGCWMAASALLAWGLSINKPSFYGPILVLVPWIRPEGMICVIAFGIVLIASRWFYSKNDAHVPKYAPWIILGLSVFSMVGVFALNYALTGHCQFSSVANKGYFTILPFSDAVKQTADDLLQIVNSYLFGLVTSAPRNLMFPVFLGSIFIWLGIIFHPWRHFQSRNLCVLLLGAGGSILTVASSGWQGTNFDRYLAWIFPLYILFLTEGLITLITWRTQAFRGVLIPVAACIIFFSGTAFVSICRFNICRTKRSIRSRP